MVKRFPEPVLLPCSFSHFINGDTLCFREHGHYENVHGDKERTEEEEDVSSHSAQHGQESLSYNEGATHVGGDGEEKTRVSNLQWEDFTRYQPPQRTP